MTLLYYIITMIANSTEIRKTHYFNDIMEMNELFRRRVTYRLQLYNII